MKIFRVASALVLVFGLLMIAFGSVLLESVDRNTALLEYLQRGGMGTHIDAQALKRIIIENAIGYVVIGGMSALCGIGLLLRRRWARWIWLGLLTVILAVLTFGLTRRAWHGVLDSQSAGEYAIYIGIIALVGWYFLRERTASYLTR